LFPVSPSHLEAMKPRPLASHSLPLSLSQISLLPQPRHQSLLRSPPPKLRIITIARGEPRCTAPGESCTRPCIRFSRRWSSSRCASSLWEQFPPLRPLQTPLATPPTCCSWGCNKLRIVTLAVYLSPKLSSHTLGLGTRRQKMALERRTNPRLSRRACTCDYWLQSTCSTGGRPRGKSPCP
jgi:hypothetical protein